MEPPGVPPEGGEIPPPPRPKTKFVPFPPREIPKYDPEVHWAKRTARGHPVPGTNTILENIAKLHYNRQFDAKFKRPSNFDGRVNQRTAYLKSTVRYFFKHSAVIPRFSDKGANARYIGISILKKLYDVIYSDVRYNPARYGPRPKRSF